MSCSSPTSIAVTSFYWLMNFFISQTDPEAYDIFLMQGRSPSSLIPHPALSPLSFVILIEQSCQTGKEGKVWECTETTGQRNSRGTVAGSEFEEEKSRRREENPQKKAPHCWWTVEFPSASPSKSDSDLHCHHLDVIIKLSQLACSCCLRLKFFAWATQRKRKKKNVKIVLYPGNIKYNTTV